MLWYPIRRVFCGKVFKKIVISEARYSFHYGIVNTCRYVELIKDF